MRRKQSERTLIDGLRKRHTQKKGTRKIGNERAKENPAVSRKDTPRERKASSSEKMYHAGGVPLQTNNTHLKKAEKGRKDGCSHLPGHRYYWTAVMATLAE